MAGSTPTYTNLNDLIVAINDRIGPNGNEEITGFVHRQTLQIMAQSLYSMMNDVLPEIAASFPEWAAGTTYEGGSEVVVRHDGKLWLFVKATNSTGQEPGTASLVWKEVSALQLAHFQNHDQALDGGGPNEVTAEEIRAHLDAADEGGMAGAVLYVSAATGDDTTGERGNPKKPYASFDTAWMTAQDGDTINILEDHAVMMNGAAHLDKRLRVIGGAVYGGGTLLVGSELILETSWGANITVDEGGALRLRGAYTGYVQVNEAGMLVADYSSIGALLAFGPADVRSCRIASVSVNLPSGSALAITESTVQGGFVINATDANAVQLANVAVRGSMTNTSGGPVAIIADNCTTRNDIAGEDITVTGAGNAFGSTGGGPTPELGTIAEQDADDVTITGGAITGTAIEVASPATSLAAANKAYVDAAVAGMSGRKMNVRVATTANVNLAAMTASHDGVTLAIGNLFLARSQTASNQNGIYIYNGAGVAATRHPDYDTFDEVAGALIIVNEGSTLADSMWLCISNPGGTLGGTSIAFSRIRIDLSLPVAIAQGGTGATTAAAARAALGTNNASTLDTGTVAPGRLPVASESEQGAVTLADTALYDNPGVVTNERMWQMFGLRYMSIITQSGTDPIEPQNEVNQLGSELTWSRIGAGHYRLTSDKSVFNDRTLVFATTTGNTHVRAAVVDFDKVEIYTYNTSWAQVDNALGYCSFMIQSMVI